MLEENFGDRVFARASARRSVSRRPREGMSVFKYDPDGMAAHSYRQLAKEVSRHGNR